MLRNGWWAWISDSYPAGKYKDITITEKEWNSLKKDLSSDSERILCDRAWPNESLSNLEDRKLLVSGHVKPIGKELEAENAVLGHFRGKKIKKKEKYFSILFS